MAAVALAEAVLPGCDAPQSVGVLGGPPQCQILRDLGVTDERPAGINLGQTVSVSDIVIRYVQLAPRRNSR